VLYVFKAYKNKRICPVMPNRNQITYNNEKLFIREKRKTLETAQERGLRLHQMKEATKCLISNETSQKRSIRLEDAANRSAFKISIQNSMKIKKKKHFEKWEQKF
jgi:hypothetical protein